MEYIGKYDEQFFLSADPQLYIELSDENLGIIRSLKDLWPKFNDATKKKIWDVLHAMIGQCINYLNLDAKRNP